MFNRRYLQEPAAYQSGALTTAAAAAAVLSTRRDNGAPRNLEWRTIIIITIYNTNTY